MPTHTVCIIGPGAVGGMLAVHLARAGLTVTALGRPSRVAAINGHGLTLHDRGQVHVSYPRAATNAAELGPQDLIVVALKSNGLSAMAPEIKALCGPQTQIVFPMNGVPWWFFDNFGGACAGKQLKALDPDGTIADNIPLDRVIWAIVNSGVCERDGAIHHSVARHMVLGRPDGTMARLEETAEAFGKVTSRIELTPRIRDAIWIKLQTNLINPISALATAAADKLFLDPYVCELMIAMAQELRTIATKLGIDPGPDPAERIKATSISSWADIRSSMLQDVDRGRPLEVDSLLGAVVEIGEMLGVPLPHIRAIYGLARVRSKGLIRTETIA